MPSSPTGERTGSFSELRQALLIDKNSLDDDLVEQPDLFYRVSEQYTQARSFQDQIKTEITQLESELGAQIREEAELNKAKVTVDAVKQEIAGSPKMIALQKEFWDAATTVGKWASLKESYDMRASALKSLVQLYASNYFSVQTGSRPRAEAMTRLADEARAEGGNERREREPRQRPRLKE